MRGAPARRLAEPPRAAWVPAAIGVAFLAVPLAALVARAPWSTLAADLASDEARAAIGLSLLCSACATLLAVAIGLPLAWILARSAAPGLSVLRALVVLPAVLPPVVGGLALLMAFGRRGLLGPWLEETFGVVLPFTTTAAVLAEAWVATPFFVLAAEAGFRSADASLEEAAATLGAGPTRRFLLVTLPLATPALGAGVALAWARALGEFGATITFAGSFPGRTRTLPLAILQALESRPETAIALGVLLLALSLAVLLALRRRWMPSR